jgi:hypothetical protein
MAAHPEDLTWTTSNEPIRFDLADDTDYPFMNDEQLITERDRQREQLGELTMHSSSSPAVDQLRSSIQREVDRMTEELRCRARSRHPSSYSRNDQLRSTRSLSWPPHKDQQ